MRVLWTVEFKLPIFIIRDKNYGRRHKIPHGFDALLATHVLEWKFHNFKYLRLGAFASLGDVLRVIHSKSYDLHH